MQPSVRVELEVSALNINPFRALFVCCATSMLAQPHEDKTLVSSFRINTLGNVVLEQ